MLGGLGWTPGLWPLLFGWPFLTHTFFLPCKLPFTQINMFLFFLLKKRKQ